CVARGQRPLRTVRERGVRGDRTYRHGRPLPRYGAPTGLIEMLRGDLFGSGGGGIGRVAPPARLLVAALLVAGCVAVPSALRVALPVTAIVAAATVFACAAPARVVTRALAFGALLYVPLALLLLVPAFFGGAVHVAGAAAHAFGIAIRGTAVLL